jgi:arylsulfatase B
MKMNLRLLFPLLLAGTSFLSAGNHPAHKPNVIIILADDLGYADLGCQGSTEVKTPNIDSIAANGVRFTAGYVTAPQCCPSRAGLMTGRYQNRFGFEANWMPGDVDPGLPLSERTIPFTGVSVFHQANALSTAGRFVRAIGNL